MKDHETTGHFVQVKDNHFYSNFNHLLSNILLVL